MAKSPKNEWNSLKKQYKKEKKQFDKMIGYTPKKNPYYWEKGSKTKSYKAPKTSSLYNSSNYTKSQKKAPNSSNSTQQGCYIATCAYGSYDCPEVWVLRRFRDYILDDSWYGKIFIKCYYSASPTIVKYLGNKKRFRLFCKKKLDKLVHKLKAQGIEDTAYVDKY